MNYIKFTSQRALIGLIGTILLAVSMLSVSFAHAQYDYGYLSGTGNDYGYLGGGANDYGYLSGTGNDYGYLSGTGNDYGYLSGGNVFTPGTTGTFTAGSPGGFSGGCSNCGTFTPGSQGTFIPGSTGTFTPGSLGTFTPGSVASGCTYLCTPTYSSNCDCYTTGGGITSTPIYGSSGYGGYGITSTPLGYGSSYTPSYGYGGYSTPSYGYSTPSYGYSTPSYGYGGGSSAPSMSSASASSNPYQTQGQSSYNSNPNTNTNSTGPAISSSNPSITSNPYSNASTGPIRNTNTSSSNPYTTSSSNSSTGPVSSTNNNTTGPSTSSATSNPFVYSTSSNGPISNTSSSNNTNTNTNNPIANASNGPINITNTVNVVPVSHATAQPLVQYNVPIKPSCTINSSNYYTYGSYSNQPTTLTWSSSNATSAYITPNVGSVNPSGSTVVYPYGYTTYTLTVSGPSGSATCQTSSNYGSNYTTPSYVAPTYQPTYVAPSVYSQPATPSVSLTQIPYTGFDYGPVGNAIYWLALLSFAVAASYLLVYHRGGALTFARSFVGGKSDVYDLSEVEEEIEAPIPSTTPATEVVASVRELPTMKNHRITTDSMIIDRTSQTMPRIMIARA